MTDNLIELVEEATVLKLLGEALIERSKELSARAGKAMGRGSLYPKLPDGTEMACFNMPADSTVVTVDEYRLLPFVKKAYPDQITESIRPAFIEVLKRTSRNAGQACGPHGEIDFDGITVTTEAAKGPRITASDAVKTRAREAVSAVLDNALAHFAHIELPSAEDRTPPQAA